MKAIRSFRLFPSAPFAACALALSLFLSMIAGRSVAAPHSVADIGEAIAFARENKRLIVFVLATSFSDEAKAVQAILDGELALTGDEFVVVQCNPASAAHRQLFEERLKLETTTLPIVAVTDAQGNLIESASGTGAEAYERLIQLARVKTGLEKDPDKIAMLKIASDETGLINEDGVVGMRKSDVADDRVALTKVRTWTSKDGSTLLAALLEAKDAIGVFVKPDRSTVELRFDSLSDPDIAFLKVALASGSAITE